MVPSQKRLLECLRRTAASLASAGEAERLTALGAMDVVLNELLLRSEPRFAVDFYERGRVLAEEGVGGLGLGGEDLAARVKALPRSFPLDRSRTSLDCLTDRMTACLAELADAAGAPRSGPLRDYLVRVTDWQVSLHRRHLEPAGPAPGSAGAPRLTREHLEKYLRRRFPERSGLEVTSFQPLSGGFQKSTILFEMRDRREGAQALVIRAEQDSEIMRLDGSAIDKEYLTLRIAHGAGLPVPEPLWLEDDRDALGVRFLVSRKAEGRNMGTVIAASETLSRTLLEDLVAGLARVHAVRLDPGDETVRHSHLHYWSTFDTVTANTRRYVEYWVELYETGPNTPSPLIRRALNWLAANVPDSCDRPVFLHGDYGLHNILVDGERVTAMLDWEAARVGDPADELSWFLNASERFLPREELLGLYREAGGAPVTLSRIRYHDVLTCLKMAVVCNIALARLEQLGTNINLGVIGLRFQHPFTSRLNALIDAAERGDASA